jgi:uncharacterized membrane-anchored protein
MKKLILMLGLTMVFSLVARAAESTDSDLESKEAGLKKFLAKYNWVSGPNTGQLADVASIEVPEGFMMCDGNDTRSILAAFGNVPGTKELGLLAPQSLDWFIVFEFDPIGYVNDDEKDKLDAAGMLKSIREGTEYGNEMRAKQGVPPMKILGWDVKPRFNDETKLLEWAILAESGTDQVLNHNTRVLGRRGVMEVALVIGPEIVKETMPVFYKLLKTFKYAEGQKYAEFKEGDSVAKYGLAALVVGGAAVGAGKLGLFAWFAVMFKKLWKLIVIGVVAIGAGIKKLFSGVVSRVDDQPGDDRS